MSHPFLATYIVLGVGLTAWFLWWHNPGATKPHLAISEILLAWGVPALLVGGAFIVSEGMALLVGDNDVPLGYQVYGIFLVGAVIAAILNRSRSSGWRDAGSLILFIAAIFAVLAAASGLIHEVWNAVLPATTPGVPADYSDRDILWRNIR